jgi:hypothetical protein
MNNSQKSDRWPSIEGVNHIGMKIVAGSRLRTIIRPVASQG